ncbi:MAG TPA: APC family permease [Streptosporangiaceae bacterium]
MADKVQISGEVPGPAGEPSDEARPHQFGLTAAMALIVGSIIGVGIFNLPTSLAAYGPITLLSMALTTLALALALLFAALSRRLPADGGPYAYARAAFGNRLGFANAWSYWITAWAGNAAIAVGWVLYVEHFINTGHNKWFSVLLVLIGLWIPAAINLSGVKNMGSVQVGTTIVKFAALAFMAIVGLFYIKSTNYTLGRQGDGHRGHRLRLRGSQRLDHDLRRDAAGRRGRRTVPGEVQAHVEERGARIRPRRLHGAAGPSPKIRACPGRALGH